MEPLIPEHADIETLFTHDLRSICFKASVYVTLEPGEETGSGTVNFDKPEKLSSTIKRIIEDPFTLDDLAHRQNIILPPHWLRIELKGEDDKVLAEITYNESKSIREELS